MANLYEENEGFINWAQEKIADPEPIAGEAIDDDERFKLSKTIANLTKKLEKNIKREMLKDEEKFQFNKMAKENEDEGFKEFYEEPKGEDPTKEEPDGRYPLSAINRLTLNMLKVSKKYFDFTKTWDKFFEKQWEERGKNINEAVKAYHKKICKRISKFETKYNTMKVVGKAFLVKTPVTPLQKTSG